MAKLSKSWGGGCRTDSQLLCYLGLKMQDERAPCDLPWVFCLMSRNSSLCVCGDYFPSPYRSPLPLVAFHQIAFRGSPCVLFFGCLGKPLLPTRLCTAYTDQHAKATGSLVVSDEQGRPATQENHQLPSLELGRHSLTSQITVLQTLSKMKNKQTKTQTLLCKVLGRR